MSFAYRLLLYLGRTMHMPDEH